jgi:Tol biopolymer transport system component
MTLAARLPRALSAAILLSTFGLAAPRPAPAAPPDAPADTTGMTPLQRVMLQAKQLSGPASIAASDTLILPAGVRRLTSTAADEGRCDWSPDGKALYYDVLEGGLRSLVRLDLATGEVAPVADTQREGSDPAVSPDGRFLVFSRTLPQLHNKLWVMRLEDGEEAKLTDDGSSLYEGSPAWSENGGLIYYSVSNNGTANATPMVISRTGENAQVLEQSGGSYQNPAPSPSGKQIAWVIRLGRTAFLRIVDARISAISKDYEFPGYFLGSADWLPGERRFVVSYLALSAPRDGYRLGIVDLDRGQLEPWLELPAALDPRVSPDGRQVAFRARTGKGHELFLAELP